MSNILQQNIQGGISWNKLSVKHQNDTSIEFIRSKSIRDEILLNILEILVFYKMAVAAIIDFGTIFTKKLNSRIFH